MPISNFSKEVAKATQMAKNCRRR